MWRGENFKRINLESFIERCVARKTVEAVTISNSIINISAHFYEMILQVGNCNLDDDMKIMMLYSKNLK
jgi:hypothetical protein